MVNLEGWLSGMSPDQCFVKRLRVIAPTCYGACMDESNAVRDVVTKIFGGSTTYPATGSWINEAGVNEVEPVQVIEVAYNRVCVKDLKLLHESIRRYAKSTRQWAVSIDVNGNFNIIPTKHMPEGLRLPSQFSDFV